ncbi:MAG: hypothetical protein OXC06_12190 [Acidimicrobiaceae bacterium]|nr:hypothetical protein [Acidimicrobiaceae bacterium]
MTAKAQTEAQPAPRDDELVEMAEVFERREFSDEELESIRETRRSTPR